MNKNWKCEIVKKPEEFDKINKAISHMTSEELKLFRNSFNPDNMGFDGAEFLEDADDE